jgi:hypothetical protein
MDEEIQVELDKLRGSELSEDTAEIATISALGAPRSTSSSTYSKAVYHVAFFGSHALTAAEYRTTLSPTYGPIYVLSESYVHGKISIRVYLIDIWERRSSNFRLTLK